MEHSLVGPGLIDFLIEEGIVIGFGLELPMFIMIIGLLLVALEAIAPGANFIVIGVALVAAGAIGLAVPVLGSPLAQAGLVLVVGSLALLAYREFDIYGGKGQAQTRDSSSLIGREGFVTERVTETDGEIKLDSGGFDPHYKCRTHGEPIEEGARAVVTDPGGGNVLIVEEVVKDTD